ncbi:hypothetical protein UFOVP276_9 [uncultured Caudovirales phage]|uniref:Uncharacterized protein n=1 Tax=uncultured Caudovirales phage TaxID=2100421 RepID=A0A6J5LJI6_9CAUD|nr:hypothetical protein UFOVP127_146 [uncultured Caudovirales phage]CAB4134768.1 hypothetical protein UFOVP276_9 [uncultured Caudovirales phage]
MAKRFSHIIYPSLKLDCEKHLCGRCQYRVQLEGYAYCDLFKFQLELTDRMHSRRLDLCKEAEGQKGE